MGLVKYIAARLCNALLLREENHFIKECAARDQLSDHDFYSEFYASTAASAESVARVRGIAERQLGVKNLVPSDNLAYRFQDIPFTELAFDVAEEFSFNLDEQSLQRLDGTLDSLILLACLR